MSAKHDLRPWYASLPLTSLILAAPFAFVALCGNKWSPTDGTFSTLAKPKEPPSLKTAWQGDRILLTASSWLSWPPLPFAACDLQPGRHPRFAVCFDGKGLPTLLRANVEQLVQFGLQTAGPVNGRWLSDGQRYLLGDRLISTKPQLQIAPLPRPFAEADVPPEQRPVFRALSRDEEFALWEDRRPRPDGSVELLVNRISDGRVESVRTLTDARQIALIHDPTKVASLAEQIIWWTDQGRRQHVELPGDAMPEPPARTAEPGSDDVCEKETDEP